MITIENYKISGWEHAIMGMRNAKNSWSRCDSDFYGTAVTHILDENGKPKEQFVQYDALNIGPNDQDLIRDLVMGGPVHAKFRRMIIVHVDITAPLYWWKEFDTYKVGTVANSCSTMHTIHKKEFDEDDFSCENLLDDWNAYDDYGCYSYVGEVPAEGLLEINIDALNFYRKKFLKTDDKKYWWQMIQLLPSSFNQKRTLMFSYETLANIYKWRKNHKLDEWREFCRWIEELPYSEIITGKSGRTVIYEYKMSITTDSKDDLTGFVEVDEYATNKDIKLAILEDLGKCTFKKVDVDKPCASCAIDFGEE